MFVRRLTTFVHRLDIDVEPTVAPPPGVIPEEDQDLVEATKVLVYVCESPAFKERLIE